MHYRGFKLNSKFDGIFKFLSDPSFTHSSFGNVDAPSGYVALIRLHGFHGSLACDMLAAGWVPDEDDLARLQTLKRGTYVAVTDSSGFIHVFYYSSQLIFQEDYSAALEEWDAWDEQDA